MNLVPSGPHPVLVTLFPTWTGLLWTHVYLVTLVRTWPHLDLVTLVPTWASPGSGDSGPHMDFTWIW